MYTHTIFSFPMLNEVAYTAMSRWKSSLKLLYIELRVHGYILDVGTVLYMAESLRNRMSIQLCFNGYSVQCKLI